MRKILLLSILMCLGIVGYSQKIVSVSNPLEEYFQKNYDSTIFLYKSNNIEPFINIICKKGNLLYHYTYSYYNSIDESQKSHLRYNYSSKDVSIINFNITIPSVNQYFKIDDTDSINNIKIESRVYTRFKELEVIVMKPLWLKLQDLKLWSLKEETNEEFRKSNNSFSSNKSIKKDIFVLITKGNVKKLEFENLERTYYERDEFRKKVSEIVDLIVDNFTRIG
jgi:hypothetical protein